MSSGPNHVLTMNQFSKDDILAIIEASRKIYAKRDRYSETLRGKILATLFFEPSTRTRMSFQAAMQRMGGSVIGFSDISTSSMKKGENLSDTIRVVSGYCDAIVMRHPEEGSVAKAAEQASVPLINAGDGSNEHPTQTILDLYTIMDEKGTLENLKVGFVGDLRHGRTVHSLVTALMHFNPELYFISQPALGIPEKYLKNLDAKGIKHHEETDLLKVSGELDVIYVTRIQKERFEDVKEYEKAKASYRIDKSLAKNIKSDAIILHPLPRVDEIDAELDDLPQSVYFKQAHNGIPVRMALLGILLGKIK